MILKVVMYMKICFVHEEYPPETNFGGIATYQKIMAEYYANRGDKVTVITRGKENIDYYENKVHIYRIASNNDPNDIKSVKDYRIKVAKLLRILQDTKAIDFIETPDWGANTVYFEKYRKIPLIIRLHTPLKIWLKFNNNNFGTAKDLILKWEKMMLKKADLLTSCSQLLKEMVIKEYRLKSKIFVIPNPYNKKEFFPYCNNQNNNIIYVGSLEERKGIITLAQALNIVMDKIPDINIYIVGKDTNRNNKNISTKKYILNLIDKKFHGRLIFTGQIDNNHVNEYLNQATLAIFPSIFDNYPYVVLESMAAGKNIICSDNMGVVDLVEDNNYIFKSENVEDLTNKILRFFYDSKNTINENNIKIVDKVCNQKKICEKMRTYYKNSIKLYEEKNKLEKTVGIILNNIEHPEKITKIYRWKNNLANDVFCVVTNINKYIVKKYNYEYDFELCNKLYDLYGRTGFNVVKPINKNIISINDDKYNIFNYINHTKHKIPNEFFIKLLNCERKVDTSATLLNKCTKYYNYLSTLKKYKIKEEKLILEIYEKISDLHLLKETYLNHGDLSNSNILYNNGKYYIIDFDEATITTRLYDFAVIMVKNNVVKNKFIKNEFDKLINETNNGNYTTNDYIAITKFYLCKILLEKFYLHEKGLINLYSKEQIKDNYKKYIKLLKNLDELKGDEDG